MKRICLFLGFALLFPALAQAAEKPLLRVGARVFTEQTILAELTAQYLRTKNYDVQITGGLGSNLARSAQESGQLDLLWEYTGVSLVSYNHIDEKTRQRPDLCAGQGSRCKERPDLAFAVEVQQHLCAGAAAEDC